MEFCWYVVLDLLLSNDLLHLHQLRLNVGGAASQHVQQSFVHMKAFVLAPVEQRQPQQQQRQGQTDR